MFMFTHAIENNVIIIFINNLMNSMRLTRHVLHSLILLILVPRVAPACRLSSLGVNSLKVEWDALTPQEAQGIVVSYKIYYRRKDSHSEQADKVAGTATSYIITGKNMGQDGGGGGGTATSYIITGKNMGQDGGGGGTATSYIITGKNMGQDGGGGWDGY